ncbi:MAG: NEW3 domain-containing protein [Candidatus Limivivens sp.]|nr:NEW3 domain-containing protein [Candidatus Limivivens sp.]
MSRRKFFNNKLGAGAAVALLTGILMAAGPVSVFAAESGLDMSTDYPGITVKAGESVNFGLDFESLSGDSYDAALSIESMPEGWDGYFKSSSSQISKVHVNEASASSSSSLATFSLTLPDEVTEGTYTVKLKADAGNGNSDILELEITVNEVANGQGSFSTEYPEQQGATGTNFSFDATIVNNKGTEQSFSLAAEAPTGWQVTFTPSDESTKVASMVVDPESSKGLTISVTPPEDVEKGEYTIPCTAISANETLKVDLTVEITGTYGVSLSTPTGRLSLDAYANDEKALTLSIENTGNVDLENLNLTSSAPSNWEVRFDESTIDLLEAGATKEVTAYIKPDSDAITGDYVTSISIKNSEASSSADFRVSVKTRTSWGIFAVAIIVVLLAGLGYVFKKFGRR